MCVQLCYAMLMAVQHGLCACSAACCDSAQSVAVCLGLIWRVMCSCMLLHLRSAVPCNNDSAALSVFMRFACCDLAHFVAVCLNLMDSQVQQHIASCVFSCVMQC